MIYKLLHSTYDGSSSIYLETPENTSYEDFKSLCDDLMYESAKAVLEGKAIDFMCQDCLIGYGNLIGEVAARLVKFHGCKIIKLPTVEYKHGLIIDDEEDDNANLMGDLLSIVIKYNKDDVMRNTEYNENIGREPNGD